MLLVSAQMPGPWLSWIQLPVMSALVVSQNLPPPVQPQSSYVASQSAVLLPTISLCSRTTSRTPSVS